MCVEVCSRDESWLGTILGEGRSCLERNMIGATVKDGFIWFVVVVGLVVGMEEVMNISAPVGDCVSLRILSILDNIRTGHESGWSLEAL